MMNRREFIYSMGAAAFAALPSFAVLANGTNRILSAVGPGRRSEERQNELIGKWDEATGCVRPEDYFAYLRDGDTRGFKALKALDFAFDRVLRKIKETVVTGDAPAVWSVYNMGYIVKTREALFSIDLKHRRSRSLVPLLDFALVTHKHGDHYDGNFCKAMDEAGKPLVSSFVENAAFGEIKAKAAAEGKPFGSITPRRPGE